jgi:nitroreductase
MNESQTELGFGTDAGLWNVMSTMRAMRKLRPDPVPREMLEQLVEAASWAPSGNNAQSYSWIVVTDRQIMQQLEPIWAKCFEFYCAAIIPSPGETMNQAQITGLRKALTYQSAHLAETPALLVACHERVATLGPFLRIWRSFTKALAGLRARDAASLIRGVRRSTDMIEAASIYPGIQNVLLTARALGLGATLTNWHLMFEAEFKRALGHSAQRRDFCRNSGRLARRALWVCSPEARGTRNALGTLVNPWHR